MSVKIMSKPYGEIEIAETRIIDFPEGILGFDFVRQFAVLDTTDDSSPFKWLQALEEPNLAFVIIQPADFIKSYVLDVSASDIEAVGASDKKDLLVFAIVTIPDNPSNMTANLQGPVIINPAKQIGRQAISQSDKYTVRHRIVDEIERTPEDRGK